MKDILASTNRINLLFDFYASLLTEKQQLYMTYYYQDDLSLREIADNFHITRQAVYEHIKKAEQMLETFEAELQLLQMYEKRQAIIAKMEDAIAHATDQSDQTMQTLHELVQQLKILDR